ncbi:MULTISPECIES: ABC transporter substrate-binding protein [unclassified Paenibacillus]|uniref:ABC transporter substrate-binding protein n=1 Tax=unclassified Paenibacillus TaxID=185978 RepID=UPI001C0FB2EA|nr:MULTISPECIES: extracellular solute-binding protein [unclassified Paenibacillus]MBU5440744.1 extracellular solute-binding protein [Paenibacillus sp. MSJ-34]CAH0120400.1 hypothetical protein PAE9249_02919 [Paenibacillus sp. CECT 9249]
MRRMRRYAAAWIGALAILLLASGCLGEKSALPGMPKDGAGTLKVMYGNEQTFRLLYGDYFQSKYPNVEIEIVDTKPLRENTETEQEPAEHLLKLIEKEKPDLILLDKSQVSVLAEKGKLMQLDAVMQQENFDTSGIPGQFMDYFRQIGDGSIYAISPTYTTQAIYYNAGLFAEHGIEPPRNQMTWDEIAALASRFGALSTEEQPLYGLSSLFPNSLEMVLNIAQTLQIGILDSRGEKMQFETEGWNQAFGQVAELIKNNGLYAPEEPVFSIATNETPFAMGQSAMTIRYVTQSEHLTGDSKFEVGLVTMPVNPASPETSPFIFFNDLFAINQDSENKRLAWELLHYMCSPEMADFLTSGLMLNLPIRNERVETIGGLSAEPFTLLKPSLNGGTGWDVVDREPFSQEFRNEVFMAMENALNDMAYNDVPVNDALAAMQQDLQAKLDLEKRK